MRLSAPPPDDFRVAAIDQAEGLAHGLVAGAQQW